MMIHSTIVILAGALFVSGCARHPISASFTMMFLLIVSASGPGLDWLDQSAEKVRKHNNAKPNKK
jgi:hypothetical protein